MPDLADGDPQISADNKTITIKIKHGHQVRAAGQPRGHDRRTSSTPSSAPSPATSPSGYAGTYFSSTSGRARRSPTGKRQADLGHQTPDDTRSSSSSPEPTAPLVVAGAGDADHGPGARRSTRRSTTRRTRRRTTSTSPSPARTWSRTTRRASSIGYEPGKQIAARPQPELGPSDRLPARVPGRDHHRRGQRRPDRRLARGCSAATTLLSCDAGSPPAPILKRRCRAARTSSRSSPSGGTRYIALNTTVKPFDNVNVRKAVIAGIDRNALRQTRGGTALGHDRDALPPAGHPRLRGGRRRRRAPAYDFLTRTRRATWRSPRST